MPLDFLAQPAVDKAAAHLKASDLVLQLHQVVEHRDVGWLVLIIECMALHNVCVIVPLLVLTKQLASLNAVGHRIVILVAVARVHVGNPRA